MQLTNEAGEVLEASALIHQDPQYLSANRISLLGTHKQSVAMLSFSRNGIIEWRFHTRPDWKLSDDPGYKYIQRGKGILRSSGMTQGAMIADDSIQPYAEIEIIETVDELHSKGLAGPEAEFWFLQRPKYGWYIHRRSWGNAEPSKLPGPWTKITALGLRFRLLRIANYRDDERITHERERIDLPGVQFQPIGSMNDEEFFRAADSLWFSFRVLLAFRYRQSINTLAEIKEADRTREMTWHTIRLEPRSRRPMHDAHDPPFRGRIERYLAKSATLLAKMQPQKELLHAASFGYSSSYSTSFMESQHTACIEGIERLVEAFEQTSSLTRERIDKKRWRRLGKAVRKQARSIEATPDEHTAIERMLTEVPRMHLLERLVRMAKSLPPKSRKGPLDLLEDADKMIKARNDIVHGRTISDYNHLMIELLRAQKLFEWLWLGFFGCGSLQDAGWARYVIDSHKREG